MNKQVILTEEIPSEDNMYIYSPILDGQHTKSFTQYLIDDNDGSTLISNSVSRNAYQVLKYFVDPSFISDKNTLRKTLCVGRVQSGKTSFFLCAIALAFDNGYDLVYIIGGTKNSLKEQNYDRTKEAFQNNFRIKVYDVNGIDYEKIRSDISAGYKVVVVCLKNSSENANLGKLQQISFKLSDIPTLVVDDEGDEYTPGAPRLKKISGRIGANHDLIQYIIYTLKICTFLSVTATPQANFLIDTFDAVSPDHCVLVEPGEGYIGGNAFHDTDNNLHVFEIFDGDDFTTSIPDSFKESLYFFLFSISMKRTMNDTRPFSMLIHPSSLTVIQGVIADKIKSTIKVIKNILKDENNVEYEATLDHVLSQNKVYSEMNPNRKVTFDFSKIKDELKNALDELATYEYNISTSSKIDRESERNENRKYKIYVGGNMLGRGLTIKNLCVTYMYRDSKVTAIDTLYQRARWLGYKESYFDICRVYMTQKLKSKFMSIVNSENDMWSSLRAFLNTKINVKQFNRIFTLDDNDGKLILTRKSVAKTIVLERISAGYQYDKSMHFLNDGGTKNRELELIYRTLHKGDYKAVSFSKSRFETQTHLVMETKLTEFYENFLSKYVLPMGSNFGPLSFQKLIDQVENGQIEDKVKILIMRYETKQHRTCVSIGGHKTIKELPQSWDSGSAYTGDKYLPGFENSMYFQIHLVYDDKNRPEEYFPILAFNNPISESSIRYVTGDGVYGD